MGYRRGDKVVSHSSLFRIASFVTYHCVVIIPASIAAFVLYRYRVHGRYNLRKCDKAITVSNHTLFFDPVIIANTNFPGRHPYQTLLESTVCAPFVGTLTRLLGGIPLPRRDMGFKRLIEGCEYIFRKNNYIHFYPEGECYLYNANPKRFHDGAFYVAAKLNKPVVPMATVFRKVGTRAQASLYILEPVYPEKYNVFNSDGSLNEDNLHTFTNDVRQMIVDKISSMKGSDAFNKGHLERINGINSEDDILQKEKSKN